MFVFNLKTIPAMRKLTFILFCLIFSIGALAQSYNTERLKTISMIWGETYLFHPSIIRSDKNIEWEKYLVEFLPQIKNINSNSEFMKVVNSELLAKLQDPFTLIQPLNESISIDYTNFNSNKEFDYIKISNYQLSDIASLKAIDSLIIDRTSEKPLIIDLRIASELAIDYHSNTFFDFLLPCSSIVKFHRAHLLLGNILVGTNTTIGGFTSNDGKLKTLTNNWQTMGELNLL